MNLESGFLLYEPNASASAMANGSFSFEEFGSGMDSQSASSNFSIGGASYEAELDCETLEFNYFEDLKDYYVPERFAVFVVFGDAVAITGIFLSLFLLAVLLLRTPRLLKFNKFLVVLCLLDICILVLYIMVISFGILYDYIHSLWMLQLWYMYVCPLFALSRIVQVAQTYLIIITSLERFLDIQCPDSKELTWIQNHRIAILVGLVSFAVLFKGSTYWEFDVQTENNCTGFSSQSFVKTSLASDPFYRDFYTVWLTPVISTHIPFVLLVLFNFLIVYRYWRMTQLNVHVQIGCSLALLPTSTATSGSKRRAQDAMYTTVVIVSSYLVSNLLSFLLSLVELFNPEYLEQNGMLYLILSDITSLMVVMVSGLRYPAYLFCNRTIRNQSRTLFCGGGVCGGPTFAAAFAVVCGGVGPAKKKAPNNKSEQRPYVMQLKLNLVNGLSTTASTNGYSLVSTPSVSGGSSAGGCVPNTMAQSKKLCSYVVRNGAAKAQQRQEEEDSFIVSEKV